MLNCICFFFLIHIFHHEKINNKTTNKRFFPFSFAILSLLSSLVSGYIIHTLLQMLAISFADICFFFLYIYISSVLLCVVLTLIKKCFFFYVSWLLVGVSVSFFLASVLWLHQKVFLQLLCMHNCNGKFSGLTRFHMKMNIQRFFSFIFLLFILLDG